MHARRYLGAALAALALFSIATPAGAQLDSDRYAVAAVSAGEVTREVRCRRAKGCKPAKPRTEMWAPVFAAIAAPARFIAGRLTCAVNVNAALAERGIRGTGSAMAKSFLAWGRPTAPVPGAVAVFHRGSPKSASGHVAIVAKVEGGKVWLWNPSRSGWRLTASHRQAIAYRSAS
jgi:hypothetical protein